MLLPILIMKFNNWFRSWSAPGWIFRGVITLLKNEKNSRPGLDGYRSIILLNTKSLTRADLCCEEPNNSDLRDLRVSNKRR